MSSDEETFNHHGTLEFRGTKYDIDLSVQNDEDLLTIHVENCETFDQWIGKYDLTYIEELSHKTGNFKQFAIFCSMLESAIHQSCDSVVLDLLTYEDLKVLREQKLGGKKQKRKNKVNADDKLQTKRYLIMTYTVEFDQIHYPLPLTYTGSADPATLKTQIQKLNRELDSLKRNTGGVNETQTEYNRLLNENKLLKLELNELNKHLKEVGTGNVSKELKVLKKVVQNLESDLLKERNKHQRLLAKKKKEYDELLEEFEELKSNERNSRIRCKSLTEELSVIKRSSRLSPVVNNRTGRYNSSGSANKNRRQFANTRSKERTNSNSSNRGRSNIRSVSRERERSLSGSSIGRTPSPGRYGRFDPSAYVREKEMKKLEAEANKSRRRTPSSTKLNRTPTSYLTKPPSGERSNVRSQSLTKRNVRNSSMESDTDSVSRLKLRNNGSQKRNSRRIRMKSDTSDDEVYKHDIPKARVTSSRKSPGVKKTFPGREGDESAEGHSIGIAEIDARLEALQKFMKDNMD